MSSQSNTFLPDQENQQNQLGSSLSGSSAFPRPWSDFSDHLLMPLKPSAALDEVSAAPKLPDLFTTPVKKSSLKMKPSASPLVEDVRRSTNPSDYSIDDLRAMGKSDLKALSFESAPITLIDEIFEKKAGHGQLDPPITYLSLIHI